MSRIWQSIFLGFFLLHASGSHIDRPSAVPILDTRNNTLSASSVANYTDYDPRFNIRVYKFGTQPLLSLSANMALLSYMSIEAQKDFYGLVNQAREHSIRPWDEVTVKFTPQRSDFQRRFLVWTLGLLVSEMNIHIPVKCIVWIEWWDMVMGTLEVNPQPKQFRASRIQKGNLSNSSTTEDFQVEVDGCIAFNSSHDQGDQNSSLPSTHPVIGGAHMSVCPAWTLPMSPLPTKGMYMCIAEALLHCAMSRQTDEVADFAVAEEGYPVRLSVHNGAYHTPVRRIDPGAEGSNSTLIGLSYTFAQGAQALWLLARVVGELRSKSWYQFTAKVSMDGEYVGDFKGNKPQ